MSLRCTVSVSFQRESIHERIVQKYIRKSWTPLNHRRVNPPLWQRMSQRFQVSRPLVSEPELASIVYGKFEGVCQLTARASSKNKLRPGLRSFSPNLVLTAVTVLRGCTCSR